MDFWYNLLTSPTIIISALLIGTFGEIVKQAVNSKKIEIEVVAYRDNAKPAAEVPPAFWKRIFFYTLPAQPVIVGLLLGLVPWLPAEESLTKPGYDLAGHLATYAISGIFCKISYDTLISTSKRMIRSRANALLASEASDAVEEKIATGVAEGVAAAAVQPTPVVVLATVALSEPVAPVVSTVAEPTSTVEPSTSADTTSSDSKDEPSA